YRARVARVSRRPIAQAAIPTELMGSFPFVPPEARDDIESAALWYEQQREGVGAQFLAELDVLLDRIREHPLQFPFVEEPVRRGLLHRFPYAVYFVEEPDRTAVLAILHQHRSPGT